MDQIERGNGGDAINRLKVEAAAERLELARGIEPPTCGLQTSSEPFSPPPSDSPEATDSYEEWPG